MAANPQTTWPMIAPSMAAWAARRSFQSYAVRRRPRGMRLRHPVLLCSQVDPTEPAFSRRCELPIGATGGLRARSALIPSALL